MYTIKLNRAAKIAAVGRYPRTWKAIIDTMPQSLIANSSSKQIATAADAMYVSYNAGHTAGYNDANK